MIEKTTSDATDTVTKTIQLTSISNTAGITTRTIGTITDKYLTNTEGTTTVSETHGPISDETTYTAAITLLKTTADQASVSPITINKPTETTETIASSKKPTKTSTSISDTQTIGFKTDDTTMIEKTTSDATDTPAKTIQLTSMSNTVGTTTRNIAAITLLKTTADQASVSPITIDKPTETTETIASSKTPTKTSTSISDTQTIGFKTDDTTMIEKTTSDATDIPAKTIQLTSMSNTVGTTTRNIGTTSNTDNCLTKHTRNIGTITDNYLTSTQGTTTVSEIHGPISDETTYTAATTLLKTTADQATVSLITNDKPTETTETIASSKTTTQTSTFIYDTQTIGFTTYATTMTDKTTSDPTDTTSKTIQLTSISNIVGLTTRTIGSISEKHVTTTKGTATVSVTHGPISDETTYTAVTTLVKTTAGQASVSPITNDKPSEIIASSETQTKPSTFIYDTPTIGFTTDDTTMTYTTTSEATVKAGKKTSNLPRYLILLA
ncbi:unnamed protein product [Mytilus edulis]|uniref:Uncharacterized protein n=1 Tax=Mytilus edulis TaxID=6550 RepID=A0A8S3RER2_MYTED|nr:unnamed protein product [Mytilus edulis]